MRIELNEYKPSKSGSRHAVQLVIPARRGKTLVTGGVNQRSFYHDADEFT